MHWQVSALLLLLLRGCRGAEYLETLPSGAQRWGHDSGRGGFHHVAAEPGGAPVRGSFGYTDPRTGQTYRTEYSAGRAGFIAEGAHLTRRGEDLGLNARLGLHSRAPPPSRAFDFSWQAADQSRREAADAYGDVRGRYSYVDDVGIRRTVDYIAGRHTGFVVQSDVPDPAVGGPAAEAAYYRPSRPGAPPGPAGTRGYSSSRLGQDGSYRFTHSSPYQRRSEQKDVFGRVLGEYSFIDDRGVRHRVAYEAGPGIGFRVLNRDSPTRPGIPLPPVTQAPFFTTTPSPVGGSNFASTRPPQYPANSIGSTPGLFKPFPPFAGSSFSTTPRPITSNLGSTGFTGRPFGGLGTTPRPSRPPPSQSPMYGYPLAGTPARPYSGDLGDQDYDVTQRPHVTFDPAPLPGFFTSTQAPHNEALHRALTADRHDEDVQTLPPEVVHAKRPQPTRRPSSWVPTSPRHRGSTKFRTTTPVPSYDEYGDPDTEISPPPRTGVTLAKPAKSAQAQQHRDELEEQKLEVLELDSAQADWLSGMQEDPRLLNEELSAELQSQQRKSFQSSGESSVESQQGDRAAGAKERLTGVSGHDTDLSSHSSKQQWSWTHPKELTYSKPQENKQPTQAPPAAEHSSGRGYGWRQEPRPPNDGGTPVTSHDLRQLRARIHSGTPRLAQVVSLN